MGSVTESYQSPQRNAERGEESRLLSGPKAQLASDVKG